MASKQAANASSAQQEDFNQKLQKLQLSEQLEMAMQQQFADELNNQDDPFLQAKFDVNDYLNANFGTEEQLTGLDDQIKFLDTEIGSIDEQIKTCIREQAYSSESAREELKIINEESANLVDRIQRVKASAISSEQMVQSGCTEIRKLDTAKKNLTFAITSLKRLIMLIQGIEQQRACCIDKRYKDAAHMIEATDELLDYFKDYINDIPEIKDVKKERDHLCNELRMQILEEFNMLDKGSIKDKLYEACFALDAIGEKAVNDLRSWFSQHILEPYNHLFQPGQPDATLENTKRRFSWLKRTMKEFQEKGYEAIFPVEWQMKPLIAYEFCRMTKVHLDQILSENQGDLDIAKVIEVMQLTTEFENDLQRMFAKDSNPNASQFNQIKTSVKVHKDGQVEINSGTAEEIREKYQDLNKEDLDTDQKNQNVYDKLEAKIKIKTKMYKFQGMVVECFEPHLKFFSASEQSKIINVLEQILAEGDKEENIDFTVFGSSLHLFKNIKASLKVCMSFSKSKAMFDLHISFKNILRHYTKLLKNKLPKQIDDGKPYLLSEEQERKAIVIVNTCEYCLETIPKLSNQLQDTIDEEYVDQIDLNASHDSFRELINTCIMAVIGSIEARNDKIYTTELIKQNWMQFEGVVDTSAYIKSVAQIIQQRTVAVKSVVNPVYFTYFMNKTATIMPMQFLNSIYKIRRINDASSHQFLLDLEELKHVLTSLPTLQASSNESATAPSKPNETYQLFVNKNIQKVESRLKVLGYPLDQIKEAYQTLVTEEVGASEDDLKCILTIRGVQTNEFKKYMTNFINSL